MKKTKHIEKLKTNNSQVISPMNLVNLSNDKSIRKFRFSADEKGEITLHIKWKDKEPKYEDIYGTYNISMFFKDRYENGEMTFVDFPHDPNSKKVRKFIIPIKGLTKEEAEKSIRELMSEYQEDIIFDDENGELKINDDVKIPHTKDFWLGTPSDMRSPIIESINPNVDNNILEYFTSKFIKKSNIPNSKLDK